MYEVAKNNEIDRRIGIGNNFKHKNFMEKSFSNGDLDNLPYFYFYFRTPFIFFIDFTSFAKCTNSIIKKQ